jgi:hypothetical protein
MITSGLRIGSLTPRYRFVFAIGLLVVAVCLFMRVWSVQALYTKPDLRPPIQSALQYLGEQKGWLISDLSIGNIDSVRQTMHVWYQPHVRVQQPKTCVLIQLQTRTTEPCAN